MYGVPKDLDLTRFQGATLVQVALGEHQVLFRFHPEGEIAVEGRWELRDAAGTLVDQARPNAERECYRLHRLLGRAVTSWAIDPPQSFTLHFSGGERLQVFDDSRDHESFSVQPGDIFV
jgi:hypothetical protein